MSAVIRSGFVAIAGRPNSGKSTILNHILGSEVSIVSPKAQTTRERVLGILSEGEGADIRRQIVFVDTPGIHKAKDGGINEYMVHEARAALEAPSLIWYIVDPFSGITHEKAVLEMLAHTRSPILLLMNKIDICKNLKLQGELIEALKAQGNEPRAVLTISALRDLKLKEVMDATWALIPEGPVYYPDADQLSDRPMRFFAAEKIREQLLRQLGEELPYSCAVEIAQFKEPSATSARGKKEISRIEAVIHVERDSQKGMVVGAGGSKIKAIGTAARAEIEKMMGEKVFLGLHVKVLKDWTRDREQLRKLGYNLPKAAK